MKINRRRFLAGLVYLVWSGFLPSGGNWDKLRTASKTGALGAKLANFHSDKQSAKAVGQAYLRSVSSEAKVDLLIDLICSVNGAQRAAFAQADKVKLTELLMLRQRQDFEHERVVNVRGWILSETECRVCALAALT